LTREIYGVLTGAAVQFKDALARSEMEWKSIPHCPPHCGANQRIREFPVVTSRQFSKWIGGAFGLAH
jgi:hypothetical protein